ncbi:uncharacterized protein GGS22DRAFT_26254 [Annulohypoxylon maeteangense]|uniref:uncharacterized protein n=1 Tax=Annulohypoxylon maeteangense TaxID=1927788 RepID=UPI002008231C|nr:uncharacterized protein GGS22DRAFT_26254 [Annulohypoxylon maeteangense]KAI0883808.1 hypothetical protein GGS22DRAFT_26254 [Annulohypoxylon maeteangense]
MAPGYLYQNFTLQDAIDAAGPAPTPAMFGYEHACYGEPSPEFFQNINPATAHAFFSTNNGETQFRHVENPLAFRQMGYWDARGIQSYADQLRSKFFDRCMYIQPLSCYQDMYIYFDAHDIYHLGAQNLWNVIHHMHYENQVYAFEQGDKTIPWIDATIQQALYNPSNQEKLRSWSSDSGNDILSVFSHGELGPVHDLAPNYHDTIRSLMMNHWMTLSRGHPVAPQYQINSKYIPPTSNCLSITSANPLIVVALPSAGGS